MPERGARTTLAAHKATRAVEAAVANPAWINAALVQCTKDVAVARLALDAKNEKAAVTMAYDAIRTAVECHMNASKLRIANQAGAHRVAIDYAAEKMKGLIDEPALARYEQLRVLRHSLEYPFSASSRPSLTPKDAAAAVDLAESVLKAVVAWWAAKQPKAKGAGG